MKPVANKLSLIFSSLILCLGLAIGIDALAQSSQPINWSVRALKVATPNPKQPGAFYIHCKRVDFSPLFQLTPGQDSSVSLFDQDNNCLHLKASTLTLDLRETGVAESGARIFETRVTRYELKGSVRTSKLKGGESEFQSIVQKRQQIGQVPIPYNEGYFFTSDDEVYFGEVVSSDVVRLECRQYVQTIFGYVNPVGARYLTCQSVEGSALNMAALIVDSAIPVR
mgnify:CR=1 FL=1